MKCVHNQKTRHLFFLCWRRIGYKLSFCLSLPWRKHKVTYFELASQTKLGSLRGCVVRAKNPCLRGFRGTRKESCTSITWSVRSADNSKTAYHDPSTEPMADVELIFTKLSFSYLLFACLLSFPSFSLVDDCLYMRAQGFQNLSPQRSQ